jgi:hypothetical protein
MRNGILPIMAKVTHTTALEKAGRRLEAARAEEKSAVEEARAAALAAVADGVTQAIVARHLKVNRITVGTWVKSQT